MTWIWIVAALIVVAALTPLAIGALYPTRSLATQIITRKLASLGIGPHTFSKACTQELGDSTVKLARLMSNVQPGPWRSHLQEHAEATALEVYAIVVGERDRTAQQIAAAVANDATLPIWQILAKHDPKRFSLDSLEMTQSTNRLVQDADGRRSGVN